MQSSRRIHRRSVAFFLAVAVAGLVFGGALLAAGGPTPVEVYPPNATVKGRTVAEWGALWWQWAVAGPKDVNPVADGTGQFCHNGEPEDVVFLAGTFGGPQVTRECTIPGGKEIFFPVLNNLCVVCRTDRPRKNCGELKADCTAQIDAAVELKVTFDGVDIMDPANLFKHREAYPPVGCYQVFIPPNSIAACESKWYEPACHEGIYLMIKPLPPGGPYDLRVYGRKDSPAFTVDVLYKLTVVDVASPPRFFRRGDVNGDAEIDISDPVAFLGALFSGAGPLACEDASDSDDSGALDLTDAIFTLNYLFLAGPALPWPGPKDIGCAADPTPDALADCTGSCRGS